MNNKINNEDSFIIIPQFKNMLTKVEKAFLDDQGLDLVKMEEQGLLVVEGYVLDKSTMKRRELNEIWLGTYCNEGGRFYNPVTKVQWYIRVSDEAVLGDCSDEFEDMLANATGPIKKPEGGTIIQISAAVTAEAPLAEAPPAEGSHVEQTEGDFLPEDIFEKLPNFLKSLVGLYKNNRRDKDIVLLSALGLLSSCFPYHYGVYDARIVAANLFLFISAPASSGKGVVNAMRGLANAMQEKLDIEHSLAVEDYEGQLADAKEENSRPPFKPKRKLFFIPANNSASKIIDVMNTNGNFGVLMETEADTLVQALKNDWGNFSDTIRKSFHHEPIEMQRKRDDEYISINRSFLSIVLTGTPNQVAGLLSNIENGFFSRFMYYDFPLTLDWKDVFEDDKHLPEIFIRSLSADLGHYQERLQLYFDSKTHEDADFRVSFKFANQQKLAFNSWFSVQEEIYAGMCGVEYVANVRRMGLIFFRIAMLLTIIREMDNGIIKDELVCSTDDFDIAKSISECLLIHGEKVYTRITNSWQYKKTNKQQDMYALFDKLPDSFDTAKYQEVAASLDIKAKTAEYRIGKYVKDGTLIREKHGFYRKVA